LGYTLIPYRPAVPLEERPDQPSRRSLPGPRALIFFALTLLPQDGRLWIARRLAGGGFSAALARPLFAGDLQILGGMARGVRLSAASLPLEQLQAHYFLRGNLEVTVQEALRRHLAPDGVLYDIGANLGFFSLLGARLAGSAGRVFAFEPVPANATAVRRHSALNPTMNVTVLELAVGARSGRVMLSIPEDASWAYLESYAPDRDVIAKVEIDVASIDELLDAGRIAPPDVVKIDTEGAELQVMRGMERTIVAHRPAIVCEMHGRNAEFVALAQGLGYVVTNLDGTDPPAEAGQNIHVLALPRA